MKYLITSVFSFLFLIANLSGQSQLEVEAPSSEVVKVKSTTGVTTTITLENDGDLPVGGAINNRRGYLETRANDVIVGASSNNTGGDIILKLPATSLGRIMLATNTANHVVMRSNGDLGIGSDTPTKKLDVDGEVRIRNLPAGGATDQVLTADASGNIRKVDKPSVIEYFLSLPNGFQILWDAGETPINLLNGGASPSDFIGLNYQGGIIFYMENDGTGLIAAPNDQSTGTGWGCSGTTTGARETVIVTGSDNTDNIIADCSESGIAARICKNLTLNGFFDWFLPSRDELAEMYSTIGPGGIGSQSKYWRVRGGRLLVFNGIL